MKQPGIRAMLQYGTPFHEDRGALLKSEYQGRIILSNAT
jgi:hypothetical protein